MSYKELLIPGSRTKKYHRQLGNILFQSRQMLEESPRRCDCQLTPPPWFRQPEALYPLAFPWNLCSAHWSHSGIHFNDTALRKSDVLWNRLDCVHDWTSLRSLNNFLRYWWAGPEIYSFCSCPRWDSSISSLAFKPFSHQSGVASFLSLFLPSVYGG